MPNRSANLSALLHLQPLILNLAALCEETLGHLQAQGNATAHCAGLVSQTLRLTQQWAQLPPGHRAATAPQVLAMIEQTQRTCDEHLAPVPGSFTAQLQQTGQALQRAQTESDAMAANDLRNWTARAIEQRRIGALRMMTRSVGRARVSVGNQRQPAPALTSRLQARPHLIWTDSAGFPVHLSAEALELLGEGAQTLLDEASGQADVMRAQTETAP